MEDLCVSSRKLSLAKCVGRYEAAVGPEAEGQRRTVYDTTKSASYDRVHTVIP